MSGHNSRLRLDTNDYTTFLEEDGGTEDPVMSDEVDWTGDNIVFAMYLHLLVSSDCYLSTNCLLMM